MPTDVAANVGTRHVGSRRQRHTGNQIAVEAGVSGAIVIKLKEATVLGSFTTG
jgi:hypothetical protein